MRVPAVVRRHWPIALALVAIEALFVWVVSAGRWGNWPSYMGYYDLLAEGFRSGHLHLSVEPAPEFLAYPYPMDQAMWKYWLTDAVYYRGHYYFYWGPLPALLLAGVKAVLGLQRSVGDEVLVFGFFSLAATASTALLFRIRERLFPSLPLPLLLLGVLACGVGTPVTYLLASTSVYQAAISGGQGFLMFGTLLAFIAISERRAPGAGPATSLLIAAGTAWGAAISCRLSLLLAIVLLMAGTTWLARGGPRTRRQLLRDGLALAVPFGFFLAGLMLYNKLRFDDWFDSGINKQLTTWPFRFSPKYILGNLFQYYFRPATWTCEFPYAVVPYGPDRETVVPRWMPFTDGYMTAEPVAGLAWALPLVWGAPLVGLSLLIARLRARRRAEAPARPAEASLSERQRLLCWCLWAFAVMASVTAVAPLGLYMATMRYAADFSFGASLLGLVCLWALRDRLAATRRRVVVATVTAVTCAACIVFAFLLGYQGYNPHFARLNPQLAARLVSALSLCR